MFKALRILAWLVLLRVVQPEAPSAGVKNLIPLFDGIRVARLRRVRN